MSITKAQAMDITECSVRFSVNERFIRKLMRKYDLETTEVYSLYEIRNAVSGCGNGIVLIEQIVLLKNTFFDSIDPRTQELIYALIVSIQNFYNENYEIFDGHTDYTGVYISLFIEAGVRYDNNDPWNLLEMLQVVCSFKKNK